MPGAKVTTFAPVQNTVTQSKESITAKQIAFPHLPVSLQAK